MDEGVFLVDTVVGETVVFAVGLHGPLLGIDVGGRFVVGVHLCQRIDVDSNAGAYVKGATLIDYDGGTGQNVVGYVVEVDGAVIGAVADFQVHIGKRQGEVLARGDRDTHRHDLFLNGDRVVGDVTADDDLVTLA